MTVYLSRIALTTIRKASQKCYSTNMITDFFVPNTRFSLKKNDMFNSARQLTIRTYTTHSVKLSNTGNRKTQKKKISIKTNQADLSTEEGHYLTMAYASANSYDLKALEEALAQQKLYEPGMLKVSGILRDVVIANAVYNVGSEPREIIFFREGGIVFWNCSEMEATNVLDFVRPFEIESYPRDVVEREREVMTYMYQQNAKTCHLHDSAFVLVKDRDSSLERYTFSHAMVQSARLGAWESQLETLAECVSSYVNAMQKAGGVKIGKGLIVRKLGEVFSLRHLVNIESDLLDTPDFYWEEERLERLYSTTVAYFTIPRRTRILNERLVHCVELLELLSAWAADRHHVRLEWMVIALICAEVAFEILHLFERWFVPDNHSSEHT